jgi:uncharacterized protein (TIGR00369 family)
MSYKPLNTGFEREVRDSFERQSIMSLLGARISKIQPGIVEISLPFRTDLTQQHGYLHAGVLATIADSACGYAAYTLMPPASEVLSIEFKINLLRPASGTSFVTRAEVVRPGKTVTAVHADVFAIDEEGKQTLVANMQATMICLRKQQ